METSSKLNLPIHKQVVKSTSENKASRANENLKMYKWEGYKKRRELGKCQKLTIEGGGRLFGTQD